MRDLTDPEFREALARDAYFSDRAVDVVVDREHDMSDARYFALDWACLSIAAQRPYRTAVALALDVVVAELELA